MRANDYLDRAGQKWRCHLIAITVLIVTAFSGVFHLAAAPGDFDLTFGNGGIVRTYINDLGHYEGPSKVLVQPDGKILTAGQIDDYGMMLSFFIARYNSDGTPDLSFGWDGMIYPGLNPSGEFVGAGIALQPDGKIIAAGYQLGDEIVVHRYETNGMLDPSFGIEGRVVTGIAGVHYVDDLDLQSDGKILVAARQNPGRAVVIRFSSDGSLDPTFDADGIVLTPLSDSRYSELILQPDEKIVVVGASSSSGPGSDIVLVRYDPDGTTDSSFGSDGLVVTSIGYFDVPTTATLDANGKIVMAGWIFDSANGGYTTMVVRYNPNGTLDPTFGGNGIFTSPPTFVHLVSSVAVQADGKIAIFGSDHPERGFAAGRLHSNGSVDNSFGVDGRVATRGFFYHTAAAIQSDGKLLAAATIDYYPYEIGIVRYHDRFLQSAPFDYDADGRTDISVYRATEGAWYLQRSREGLIGVSFGSMDDLIVPADFDGDRKTDIAVFRPSDGRWHILNSADGLYRIELFGLANDLPAPADYDGDGKADICVFRPSDGTWYLQRSSDRSVSAFQFGTVGDKPTVGDFDADGRSDLAVFRPANGEWYHHRSSDGTFRGEQFGLANDKAAYADYDGDGRTDLGVFRPSEGIFYTRSSETSSYSAFVFGISEDIPTPGDYDGDGKSDISVFRPSNGNWYRLNSSNGSFNAFQFGSNGDRPTPSAFH